MAVTYLGHGTRASAQNGNVTPSFSGLSLSTGDLVMVVAAYASTTRTFTAPSGWSATTTIRNTTGANGPTIAFAWKAYAGDADPVLTITGTSSAGAGVVANIFAWRGADTSTGPTFGTAYSSGATTSSTSVGPIPGVFVNGNGIATVWGVMAADYSGSTASSTGFTFEFEDENTTATHTVSYVVLDRSLTTASTTNATLSATPTSAVTSAGVQIGINEAGGTSFSGSVSFAGSGTLSASGGPGGPVAFAGSGTLAASGAPHWSDTVLFGGSGTLVAGGHPAGWVAWTGVGRLRAFGTGPNADFLGSAAFSSTGSLTLMSGFGIDAFGTAPFGGNLNAATVQQWNGTSWVTIIPKYWDGTTWQNAGSNRYSN